MRLLLSAIAVVVAIAASLILTAKAPSQIYCVPPNSGYYITTLNTTAPKAKCFKVTNGVFSEVSKGFVHASASAIKWLDGFVLPGIIESHGHMLQYGEMLESVSLYNSGSVAEMRERIKLYLRDHQGERWGTKEKWVRGIGWDQKYFGGLMPTAAELSDDPELKDLYISLDRVDVHCSVVSNKVLELLSNPLPVAPPGGMVITDPGPGVFCDNAMSAIILPLTPEPTRDDKKRWFKSAMTELNKVGIVGAGDAGIRPADIMILEEMAQAGELTLRAKIMMECVERNTFCPEEASTLQIVTNSEGLGGNMLMLGGVKLFSDGALGSRGAALLAPYEDDPTTSGTMMIESAALTKVVKQWYDYGFQINIHAIGDQANRAAVDAFENALGKDCQGCNNATRFRIEHAQIIHLDDQKRIAKMGIIPSIQPTHATSDMSYALSRLGHDRLSTSAYRMSSLFPSKDTKTPYPGPVLSSDFPVEPANPFHGMYAAVTRLDPATGTSPAGDGGWYPDEALSVEQAVLGFTRNAGYGWMKEDRAGAIEVGKWADWVVLDRDVWSDKSGKGLRDVVVKETWVGGKIVFSRDGSRVVERVVVDGEGWRVRLRRWILRQWGLMMGGKDGKDGKEEL